MTPARRGHGPRADPVTPRGSGTGWARSWAGNPATDPTDGFGRVPRGEAAPGEGWHQRRGDTRTGVPTPGPLPTEADPPPSAVLGILRGCSLGTPQGAGRWDVMPPSPQAHGGICPNACTPGPLHSPRPTLTGCYWRNPGTSWTKPQWPPILLPSLPTIRGTPAVGAWPSGRPGAPSEQPPELGLSRDRAQLPQHPVIVSALRSSPWG